MLLSLIFRFYTVFQENGLNINLIIFREKASHVHAFYDYNTAVKV